MQSFLEIFKEVFLTFTIGLSAIGGIVGVLFLLLLIANILEEILEKYIKNKFVINIIIGLIMIISLMLLGTVIIYILQWIGLTK